MVAKILGTNNKITNVRAFMQAVQGFKEEAIKQKNKETIKKKNNIEEKETAPIVEQPQIVVEEKK